MRTTVNFYAFADAFQNMDQRKDKFTYHGLRALFEMLEDYEAMTGTEIELDVAGLCTRYSEYESVEEVIENYAHIQDLSDIQTSYRVTNIGSIVVENF